LATRYRHAQNAWLQLLQSRQLLADSVADSHPASLTPTRLLLIPTLLTLPVGQAPRPAEASQADPAGAEPGAEPAPDPVPKPFCRTNPISPKSLSLQRASTPRPPLPVSSFPSLPNLLLCPGSKNGWVLSMRDGYQLTAAQFRRRVFRGVSGPADDSVL
jgi:hypothetical protein